MSLSAYSQGRAIIYDVGSFEFTGGSNCHKIFTCTASWAFSYARCTPMIQRTNTQDGAKVMQSFEPKTITCKQARDADHKAVHQLGVPSLVLMENAARNAAAAACDLLTTFDLPQMQGASRTTPASVIILTGSGNNAGDGYALARHMLIAGYQVTIHALRDPANLKTDAAINAHIASQLGIEIVYLADTKAVQAQGSKWDNCNLLIDAMLGTGFNSASGEVRQPLADAIQRCNQARTQGVNVLALDVPSGLDADTGKPVGGAIHADVTVTFLANKQGFVQPEARAYTGKVIVCDIGVPSGLLL